MERSDVTLMELLADEAVVEVALLLVEEGGRTQKEIAEALELDSGTASRRMAELERWGLVKRDRSHGPYRLEDPGAVGEVLVSVANAAARVDKKRYDASKAHHERVLAALRAAPKAGEPA